MSDVYFETLKKLCRAIQDKRLLILTYGEWIVLLHWWMNSAPPWKCASVYSCSHSSTVGAFHLGVVWPLSLQPWCCFERLPSYLPTWEPGGIITLQQ
jgi:hypothetical protein